MQAGSLLLTIARPYFRPRPSLPSLDELLPCSFLISIRRTRAAQLRVVWPRKSHKHNDMGLPRSIGLRGISQSTRGGRGDGQGKQQRICWCGSRSAGRQGQEGSKRGGSSIPGQFLQLQQIDPQTLFSGIAPGPAAG